MLRAFAALVVLTLCQPAWADGKIGVVVSGADGIRAQSESAVKSWLTQHALDVEPSPLAKGGVTSLINCLVISDMSCARGVVNARGTAPSVIGLLELVTGKGDKRSVQLSAYWIAKRYDVISLQRTCDACTDDVLEKAIHAMIADLVRLAPSMIGRIHVTSSPPGLTALLDNQSIGVTPTDHEVPFGSHTVAVARDGHIVGQRQVDVGPSATVEVDVPVRAEPPPMTVVRPVVIERRSRTVPAVMIGIGVVGIFTGGVLYAEGNPTGANYTYRDTKPAGIAVAASGGVLALIGTLLLFRHHSSAPEVAVTPGGAVVGWAGSF